jgi:hypothetical protein
MPRKADEFEVLEKSKRAPRKRVAKTVDDSKEVKAKRTRSVKKVTEEVSERKAPTSIKEEQKNRRSARKPLIVVGVLLLIGVGSSAAIGLTDKGQIDIVTIIDERNKKAAERGEQPIAAERELLPDGGLIPADQASTASSTPQSAATSSVTTTPEGNVPRTDAEVGNDTVATATST